MIYRLTMEFTLDKKQKIDYNIGSVLQGIMMTFLDRDYGDLMHKQSLRPYSQYFEVKGNKYYWIINTLTDEAKTEIIDKILESDRRSLDLTYRKSKLNIEDIKLSEGIILDDIGKRDIIVEFKTPTSFKKSTGGYEIFPTVRHIFNSIINKYKNFISDDLDENLLEKIVENVEIVEYNLRTSHFNVKGNYVPGFMGTVCFKVKGSKEFKNEVMKLLQFAKYSGIGLKGTMGMGAFEIV